ncbi:MAG: prephenate dehydratase domain-containing protein [bacterium]|nr:prephenate dehydratase domain-containing protein [bacterium]
MKIFALGPAGSYGHEVALIAAQKLNLENSVISFQPTNTSVLSAAEHEEAMGVVPIENSTYGDVIEVLEYLVRRAFKYPLRIVGQVELQVNHCLLAASGTNNMGELQGLISHPQAIGQCQDSIARWGITNIEPATSTAAAAKFVAENPQKKFGALASSLAAREYGLTTLAQNVQTFTNNTTRFFIFGKSRISEPTGDDKTVLVFKIKNEPAALTEALLPLAVRRINMSTVHSVSLGGWNYGFYLEIDGHQSDENIAVGLERMQISTEELMVLGSFRK